jgi:hypothetical protein
MHASLALVLAALFQAPAAPPVPVPSGQAKAATPRREATKQQPTKGLRKHIKVTLSAIDIDAKTIAFRDENGRAYTWPVDQRLAGATPHRAAQALKALNPGDTVVIVYNEDEGRPTIMAVQRPKPRPAGGDRPQG